MRGVTVDHSGKRYGALTVTSDRVHSDGRVRWLCVCDCGKNQLVLAASLASGAQTRCSACASLARANTQTTHAQSRTKLYHTWGDMIQRCGNPSRANYRHYGGKGVTVCYEWQTFAGFYEWALQSGYVEGLTIERKDTTVGYSPGNCEWVSRAENSRRAAIARHQKAHR